MALVTFAFELSTLDGCRLAKSVQCICCYLIIRLGRNSMQKLSVPPSVSLFIPQLHLFKRSMSDETTLERSGDLDEQCAAKLAHHWGVTQRKPNA